MYFMGIDPGKSGGIVVLDVDLMVVHKTPTPLKDDDLDGVALQNIMRLFPSALCFIEKVHAMPGQGVSSMFTFGRYFGAVLQAAYSLRSPPTLIRPQEWQKFYWSGKQIDTKAAATKAAKIQWPTEDFLATKRSKKPHSGMVDAALISFVGFKLTRGNN